MGDVETYTADPRANIFITPESFIDIDQWHQTAAELRAENPVAWVEQENWAPFWAVTRHADVFEVSRRSDVFHNTVESAPAPDFVYQMMQVFGIEPPQTLVHIHGERHAKLRKITTEWFKPAAVAKLQPTIDTITDKFIEELKERDGVVDFAADVAVPYTLHVIMSIYGVPPEDEPLMLQLTQGIFGAGDPEYLGDFTDPQAMFVDTMNRFAEYFAGITESRLENPTNDIANVLAHAEIDGRPLDEGELLWYYIIIATAGHDTTSYSLSGGLDQLLNNPEQFEKLRDNRDLLPNAVEEIIRWSSPVRSFKRWAQEDFVLGDQLIKKGEAVLTSYPSANRDSLVFDDPMTFNIEREEAEKHLSFGLGMHYCLGAQVARRELRTFLGRLMDETESIERAGEVEHAAAHFVGGIKHLPVKLNFK